MPISRTVYRRIPSVLAHLGLIAFLIGCSTSVESLNDNPNTPVSEGTSPTPDSSGPTYQYPSQTTDPLPTSQSYFPSAGTTYDGGYSGGDTYSSQPLICSTRVTTACPFYSGQSIDFRFFTNTGEPLVLENVVLNEPWQNASLTFTSTGLSLSFQGSGQKILKFYMRSAYDSQRHCNGGQPMAGSLVISQ